MHLAHLILLVLAIVPLGLVMLARAGQGVDNHAPRDGAARLQGWRRRAEWAHRNHLETYAPFAAAVILAEFAGCTQGWVDSLAAAYLVLRLLYTLAYLADWPTARSACFSLGFAVMVWIFLLPL